MSIRLDPAGTRWKRGRLWGGGWAKEKGLLVDYALVRLEQVLNKLRKNSAKLRFHDGMSVAGAKAPHSIGFFGTTRQLAEKGRICHVLRFH